MKTNSYLFPASSILLIGLLTLGSCKKETNPAPDPVQELTRKNTEALKNSEWYGLYRNKGEDKGNNQGYRGYAVAIHTDSTFKFYGTGFAHDGYWSVAGNTVRFRFATGSKNAWRAEIRNDSLVNFTVPTPDNFSFGTIAKKLPAPPADVIGHKWTEKANPFVLTFTGSAAGVGYPTPFLHDYTLEPVQNRIFNTRDTKFNTDYLLIVDGKTAWMFDSYAYSFQYTY
jgi:hypothetical protein